MYSKTDCGVGILTLWYMYITHIGAYMHVRMYVCMHTYYYICIRTNVHMHKYEYVRTYRLVCEQTAVVHMYLYIMDHAHLIRV